MMGCASVRQTVRDWWDQEGKEMAKETAEELSSSLARKTEETAISLAKRAEEAAVSLAKRAEEAAIEYTEEKFTELDKKVAEGDAGLAEYLLWLLLGTLGLGGAGAGVMRSWCRRHEEKEHAKK